MPKFPHIATRTLSKEKKGFTLVELIFTIVIIGLVVFPTVVLLIQLTLSIVQTETNSIATSLAVQKAEEVLAKYDFNTVVASSGTCDDPADPAHKYLDYAYAITVGCFEDCNSYKQVTISVSHAGIPPVNFYVLLSKP